MLTALGPQEAASPDEAAGDPMPAGQGPRAASAAKAETPGGAWWRRGLSVAAARGSERGATEAATTDEALVAEVAAASDEPDTSTLSAADQTPSSSTSLMQWMLQMAPPTSPVQPSARGALGVGRQAGEVAASAAGLGRVDSDGKTTETRARGVSASMSQADRLSDKATAEASGKLETAAAFAPASAVPAAAAPVSIEKARLSVSPEEGRLASADGVTATAAQAAAAAAAAAAATATVTAGGSPVVAPAQTWIQTPVTQPGFSDEVVVELVRRLGQAEQGSHEVMLHLNPAEMGPVSVSIELNGTTARVEFSASESLTRQHLEAALPGLADALRDDGLSLQHGSVHEHRPDALSADAGLSGGASGGSGADPRSRGEPAFEGRSGSGERVPRPSAPGLASAGPSTADLRPLTALGPGPGRIGRLDLFA